MSHGYFSEIINHVNSRYGMFPLNFWLQIRESARKKLLITLMANFTTFQCIKIKINFLILKILWDPFL